MQLIVTGASLDEQRARARARARAPRASCSPPPASIRTTRPTSSADAWDALAAHAGAREVVAIGECGLDYFRNYSPPAAQQAAFHRQLELARALGKPVFLHQRDAHADFLAILREHGAPWRGVAHCFTGDAAALSAYLDLGLAIGITGWINDERRGSPARGAHAADPRLEAAAGDRRALSAAARPAGRNPPPGAMNRRIFRTSPAPSRAPAGSRSSALARSSTQAARALFGLPDTA